MMKIHFCALPKHILSSILHYYERFEVLDTLSGISRPPLTGVLYVDQSVFDGIVAQDLGYLTEQLGQCMLY